MAFMLKSFGPTITRPDWAVFFSSAMRYTVLVLALLVRPLRDPLHRTPQPHLVWFRPECAGKPGNPGKDTYWRNSVRRCQWQSATRRGSRRKQLRSQSRLRLRGSANNRFPRRVRLLLQPTQRAHHKFWQRAHVQFEHNLRWHHQQQCDTGNDNLKSISERYYQAGRKLGRHPDQSWFEPCFCQSTPRGP